MSFQDAHDELADDELPAEADIAGGDSIDLVECPDCAKAIDAEADVCPKCGAFILRDERSNRKPLWVVALVIVAMVLVLFLSFR